MTDETRAGVSAHSSAFPHTVSLMIVDVKHIARTETKLEDGATAAVQERKNASSRFGVTLRLASCNCGGKSWDAPGCANLESLSATSLSLPGTCCMTISSMSYSPSTKAISAPIPFKSGEELANFAVHCRAVTESLLT